MPTVGNLLFKHQFHQFFCRWGHILEALSERNDCETHSLKVLHHLYSTSTVECNLTDIVAFTQALNELFDVAVVNHITESISSLAGPCDAVFPVRHRAGGNGWDIRAPTGNDLQPDSRRHG